jgi:Ca2+-binding RTX toxin-like protein
MADKTYIIDPKAKIAGKTQSQLADDVWKYFQSVSQEDNPGLDLKGDFANVNQPNDNVFILSGFNNFQSAAKNPNYEVNRTIVVPYGKTLFVPIVGEANSGNNIIDPPTYVDTSQDFINADPYKYSNLTELSLSIDGKVVLERSQAQNYRQTTQDPNGFSFNTPENSVYVGTKYDNAFLAKSFADGYYVGIEPLSIGKHTISFHAKNDTRGGNQNVTYEIEVKPFNQDINGDDKKNTLKGNEANDNIDALGGNDTVYGYGGDDIIDGGAGNDNLYGGNGKDIVYGGAGNDKIEGGNGDDVLAGGLGNDDIEGGDSNDRLYGGSGNDKIEGGNGNDTIFGGDGNDKIEGGKGDDVIDAVAYSPLVLPFRYGIDFSGPFINSGQNQIDKIEGGGGRDTFVLGMAGDPKAGVTGSAYYVGGGDKDYALIQDFQLGANGDKIQLFSQTTNPSDYVLGAVANGLPNGVGIYTNNAAHDLIGIVQGDNVSLSTLSLTNNSQFSLVG